MISALVQVVLQCEKTDTVTQTMEAMKKKKTQNPNSHVYAFSHHVLHLSCFFLVVFLFLFFIDLTHTLLPMTFNTLPKGVDI